MIYTQNNKFIAQSLELSRKLSINSQEKFAHFCFIFNKNKLISIGFNDTKNQNSKALYFGNRYNIQKFKKYKMIHAEISAISKLWGRLEITGKEKIVVIRIGKSGLLLNSLPCKDCTTILTALGFKSVWHSVENDIVESEL